MASDGTQVIRELEEHANSLKLEVITPSIDFTNILSGNVTIEVGPDGIVRGTIKPCNPEPDGGMI